MRKIRSHVLVIMCVVAFCAAFVVSGAVGLIYWDRSISGDGNEVLSFKVYADEGLTAVWNSGSDLVGVDSGLTERYFIRNEGNVQLNVACSLIVVEGTPTAALNATSVLLDVGEVQCVELVLSEPLPLGPWSIKVVFDEDNP